MNLRSMSWLASFICTLALTACSSHEEVVIGGSDNHGSFLDSAEIYKTTSGTFAPISHRMSTGRLTATATTLTDGSVLIAGGQGQNAPQTAEIFQPSTQSFTQTTGQLNHPRIAHTATLLDPSIVPAPLASEVLITGGNGDNGTAELYDPLSKTFSNTGKMSTSRVQHTAILISHCGCAADGKVLVVGGYNNQSQVLASAELYNPATQTFTPTGSMRSPRFRHTATLLPDGTILIAGGASQMGALAGNLNPALNTAEIYNPRTGTFTPTKGLMTAYRTAQAASLLKDGTVLLTGGQDKHFIIENTAEIFNPTTGTFTATAPSCAGAPPPTGCMQSGRDFHLSFTLDNGRVLIAGGVDSAFKTVASAEIYDPTQKSFTPTGSLSRAREGAAGGVVLGR